MPRAMPVNNLKGKVLSPYREDCGKSHRVYAAPQWVQYNNNGWHSINDLMEVRYLGQGGYEITCGDKNDRIFMEPLWDTLPYVEDRIITPRHFGPTIDFGRITMKDVAWRITTSGAIDHIGNTWIFKRCDPPICGLFFDKWLAMMPRAITFDKKDVWINVKLARNDLSKAKLNGKANLDPDTVNPVANGYAYVFRSVADPTWQETIDGVGNGSQANDLLCITLDGVVPPTHTIARGLLRFDTLAYPSPSQAYLYVTIDPVTTTYPFENDMLDYAAAQAALNFPLADNANYVKAKTAIDNHGLGAFSAAPSPPIAHRVSGDIVAAGEWECSATADFVISEHHDYTEEAPDAFSRYIQYFIGEGETYLEIFLATANRIPLLGAGIS